MDFVNLRVRTWHLKRTAIGAPALLPPPSGFSIDTWKPDPSEYLPVYKTIGSTWGWSLRLRQTSEELYSYLQNPAVLLWKLSLEKRIYGFIELDCRTAGRCEIAYLGVIPSMVGKGFGTDLLRIALRAASQSFPGEQWVHTCALDHKAALGFYRREGFEVVRSLLQDELYPAEFALFQGLKDGQVVEEGFSVKERTTASF